MVFVGVLCCYDDIYRIYLNLSTWLQFELKSHFATHY